MGLWNNYIGKKYVINNPEGKVLQPADLVIYHSEIILDAVSYAYLHTVALNDDVPKVYIRFLEGNSEEKLNYEIFNRLEPVHWWSEEHRTIQSPMFKALAALLNISNDRLIDMPGYDGSVTAMYNYDCPVSEPEYPF